MDEVSGCRITPAGAGKTIQQVAIGKLVKDHPRRCGENDCAQGGGLYKVGSPPQVRGKRYGGRTIETR